MKKIFNFKSILTLGAFAFSSLSIAQEEVITKAVERPMYDKLGISPTVLFTIMTLLTVVLVIALVGLANSTSNVIKFKHNKTKKTGLLLLVGLFSSTSFAADNGASEYFMDFPDQAFWAFLILDVIIVMVILYFVGIMKGALTDYKIVKEHNTIFTKWSKSLTNAVEIENEDSILLDHDYDGIRELDNDLPPWWKYGFYITIVWAGVYFFYYQVLEIGDLQTAEFEKEMIEGEKQIAAYKEANPNLVNAENVTLLEDDDALNKGKSIFNEKCSMCHGMSGEGSIGPNLTDEYWIYGHDIGGVFNTISEGANNGMPAWKADLSPVEMQETASYILSLKFAEGKAPEGEKVTE